MTGSDISDGTDYFWIKEVRIKGFKQFGETYALRLNRGLNVLVGNNGAGKTTVMEAVNLALTARYRGESINTCISRYLFNNDMVSQYLKEIESGETIAPPSIEIDLFLGGGEDHALAVLEGDNNSSRIKGSGIHFEISFDDEYADEYRECLQQNTIKDLPIEYYRATCRSFADVLITQRSLPFSSALINPAGEWQSRRSDERAARTLRSTLDNSQKIKLSQQFRESRQQYAELLSGEDFLALGEDFGDAKAKLTVDWGTKDSWKDDLVVSVDDIPYAHIGAGNQCIIQTAIALTDKAKGKVSVILMEEPENHLSHTNLNRLLNAIVTNSNGRQMIISTHSSFVANKLNLNNLLLLNGGSNHSCDQAVRFDSLRDETYRHFAALPGYDTLRFVISDKVILVEGPSDELVVQRFYKDSHDGRLPIEDGTDVMSVGLTFKRFLEIGKALNKKVAVITDNDDDPEALDKRYEKWKSEKCGAFYESEVHSCPEVFRDKAESDAGSGKYVRWNTLEPVLVRSAGLQVISKLLNKNEIDEYDLVKWMESHKTEVALAIFRSPTPIQQPEYIRKAIEFIDE